MKLLVRLTLGVLIFALAEPLSARPVEFADKNFALEVPDSYKETSLPENAGILIYEADKDANSGFTIACLPGDHGIEGDDFASGFVHGAEGKGSVVKSTAYKVVNGKKFFVADLLQGGKACVLYVISADGHTLMMCHYRAPSESTPPDQDFDATAIIQSFHFLHDPVFPVPPHSASDHVAYVLGECVGALAGISTAFFIARRFRTKKVSP